jgi:hypothetical protein
VLRVRGAHPHDVVHQHDRPRPGAGDVHVHVAEPLDGSGASGPGRHLGFGRIVVSEIEAPILLNLVNLPWCEVDEVNWRWTFAAAPVVLWCNNEAADNASM